MLWQDGMIWHNDLMIWCCVIRWYDDMMWCDLIRDMMIRCDTVNWCGLLTLYNEVNGSYYDTGCDLMIWCCVVWYDDIMIWCDDVDAIRWYDVMWPDTWHDDTMRHGEMMWSVNIIWWGEWIILWCEICRDSRISKVIRHGAMIRDLPMMWFDMVIWWKVWWYDAVRWYYVMWSDIWHDGTMWYVDVMVWCNTTMWWYGMACWEDMMLSLYYETIGRHDVVTWCANMVM